MKLFARSLVVAMVLAGATATQAHAVDTPWAGNGTYCGGSGFTTCISINLSWSNASGTSTIATLVMTNVSPSGIKWFAVGLDNLPAGLTYSSGPSDLGFTDGDSGGLNGGPFSATIYPQGNNGGVDPGTNVPRTFKFNLSSGVSQDWTALLNAAGVGLHAGGVEGITCSTKIVVRDDLASGSAYGANGLDDQNCNPPTTAPEPATMGLLALGLVGMGGASLVRRRRKN